MQLSTLLPVSWDPLLADLLLSTDAPSPLKSLLIQPRKTATDYMPKLSEVNTIVWSLGLPYRQLNWFIGGII